MLMDVDSISKALGEFNGFHDGFVKSLTIVALDRFKSPGAQKCVGHKNVRIQISHYNYPPWGRVRTVVVALFDVSMVRVESSGRAIDWTIRSVLAEGALRAGPRGDEESCVRVSIRHTRGDVGGGVGENEDLSFLCRGVAIREQRRSGRLSVG
jgi:hypothetical protein